MAAGGGAGFELKKEKKKKKEKSVCEGCRENLLLNVHGGE